MARLPVDGGDNGVWDDLLNNYLLIEHNADGTLRNVARPADIAGFYTKPSGGVPYSDLASSVQTALDSASLAKVFLDVKSFGAKGDGTTNDSAAIQAAIAQSVTTGIPVYLSPGTYLINAALSITANVSIIGAGREKATLKATNGLNDYVIKFNGGATGVGIVGARFSDFTIDGNQGQQTAGGGILGDGAVQCVFERIKFHNCYNWGLKFGPITGAGTGHHNIASRCLFDADAASAGAGGGLWVTTSDENWVSNCDFEGLGGAINPGTETAPAMIWQADGLAFIQNCNFVGGNHDVNAIKVRNASFGRIHGCMFDGVQGDNLFVVGSGWTITGNTFTNVGKDTGTSAVSGIYLEFGATQNVVANNSLSTSTTAGRTASLIKESSSGSAGSNYILGNALTQNQAATVGLVDLSGAGTYRFGNGVAPNFLPNTTGTPGTIAGGGSLYVVNGALTWKGSGGTVTTLGAA